MNTLSLHIPPEHPAFAGHFPGMPITPGVVLLDLALHAIAVEQKMELQNCKISSVKFLSPVLPDTELTLHYERTANGSIQFDLKQGERVAVTGAFHA